MTAPGWARVLGDDYGAFRAALIGVLERQRITVDEAHIDCGVLHTPSGTLGLSNVARLCHGNPPDAWPAIIADHLRRATAKPVSIAFESAAPRLRLRLVSDRLVRTRPESYVSRELTDGIHLTVAIENTEHVVFVHPRELGEWERSAEEVFALARANTEGEPALEREDLEVPDGPTIVALIGDSYISRRGRSSSSIATSSPTRTGTSSRSPTGTRSSSCRSWTVGASAASGR